MRCAKRIGLYTDYVETEYTQRILEGAASYLTERGYELLVFPTGCVSNDLGFSYDYQYQAAASLLSKANVDGIIFVTTKALDASAKDVFHSYIKSFNDLPVVSVGYIFGNIPSVVCDSSESMKDLVRHLIRKHGCKRFCLLSVKNGAQDARSRRQNFFEVIEEEGIDFKEENELYGQFVYQIAYDALEEYWEKHKNFPFDCVVALNDGMAYACIDFLSAHNIRVPEDVLITGFDDQMRSMLGVPPLTTISQNLEEQARVAAENLCNIIEKKPYKFMSYVKARPIYRQSCNCLTEKDGFFCEMHSDGKVTTVKNDYAKYGFAEWHVKKEQFLRALRLYSDMQMDMTIDGFRKHLVKDLVSFNIPCNYVVLFENPINTDSFEYFTLPERAMLFSAYDKESGLLLDDSTPPVSFNPRVSMLPEGYGEHLDRTYVATLFKNSIIFGYVISKQGPFDVIVSTMILKIFSSNLAAAYMTNVSEQEKNALADKYNVVHTISVTDELTGLMNRRGFLELASDLLATCRQKSKGGLVVFGDMDGLKKINDTYGHQCGDIAIKAEADLIKSIFRNNDAIGRLGGDEFAIVAPSLSVSRFARIRKSLEEKAKKWNMKSGQKFTLSISLGCQPFPDEECGYDLMKLLNKADSVLYEEKRAKHALRQD